MDLDSSPVEEERQSEEESPFRRLATEVLPPEVTKAAPGVIPLGKRKRKVPRLVVGELSLLVVSGALLSTAAIPTE